MRAWFPLLSLSLGLVPASAAAQARVEAIVPATAVIEVLRLGSDRSVPATIDMELLPGDLISASIDSVLIELSCISEERRNTYFIASPFRVLVDVPTRSACHVNMLSGLTEVIAEAPTETSAGGITLGSTGTQYAVQFNRVDDVTVLSCIVYDGTVRVRARDVVQVGGGSKLVWTAAGGYTTNENTPEDIARSALVYARFDLAEAQRQDVVIRDPNGVMSQFTGLHFDVLSNPTDTTKRAALARAQLDYRITDKAVFNLNRVGITSDLQLRRNDIDPAIIRDTTSVRAGAFRSGETRIARDAIAGAELRMATTAGDLRLIADGRLDVAIVNLEARTRAGTGTSRDYFALARAYAIRGDSTLVRANAGRALVVHARDNQLTAAELRELGELIARLR